MIDHYLLSDALRGSFSSQADTMDALAHLGWLRVMLVDREAELVLRARQESVDWPDIARALRRDPTVTALLHREMEP